MKTKKSKKSQNSKSFYKNNRKLIFVTGTVFLIIFIVWFLFNFSINLFLNSSTTIKIEPEQLYLNSLNNEIRTASYNITISKSLLSQIECNYSFIDISNNKNLVTSKINLKNDITSIKFNVSSDGAGSGKKIYNLEVVCTEDSGETFEKTSFLLLSYDLTNSEKELKENLRPKLLDSFNLYNIATDESARVNYLLLNNKLLVDNTFFLDINSLNLKLNNFKKSLTVLEKLWVDERYLDFKNYNLTTYIIDLTNLERNYKIYENQIIENLNSQNETIQNYNSNLLKYLEFYNESEHLKDKLIYSEMLFDIIKELDEKLIDVYFKYNNSNYNNITQFENDIFKIKNQNFYLNNTLNEINENFTNKSRSLLEIENNIRCNIGECLDNNFILEFQNNTCSLTSSLINNIDYKRYDINNSFNLIHYNDIYYNYSNNNLVEIQMDSLDENQSIEDLVNSNNTYFLNLNSSRYSLIQNSNNNQIEILENLNLSKFYLEYCYENNSLNSSKFELSNHSFLNLSSNIVYDENISNSNFKFDLEIAQNLPQCCVGGICTNCCVDNTCKDDPRTYPVLLIHGHSFIKSSPAEPSINAFDKITYKLIEDGFIDAGILSFTNLTLLESNLASLNAPVSVKASYYYDSFYKLGSYVYITKKNDNIDTYAIRLSEIVDSLKSSTNRDKVNIVSHSMGGLVVRRYMQIFGTDSIDKVILIGSPNAGISGRVKYLCSVVGEKLECDDMADDSILIAKLNSPNYKPINVDLYTISGVGCDMDNGKTGDGVVTLNSSQLTYATNYIVNGTCSDLFNTNLHTDLLNINKYPKVYDYIKEVLVKE